VIPTNYTDPDDPNDAWALATLGYSTDKFYCRASDSNGHTEMLTVRISPNLRNMIGILAGDPDLPYASASDVMRDALTHRVRWVLEQQRTRNVALWERSQDEMHSAHIAEQLQREADRERHVELTWQMIELYMSKGKISKAYQEVDIYEDVVMDYDDQDDRRVAVAVADEMREFINRYDEPEDAETNVRRMPSRKAPARAKAKV
jgi:Arc/MetJ-type ribon-helix-helix transcriptional regulator